MILFEKIYDGESIVDAERHIYEAINESEIIADEYGFPTGEFKVTIEWKESFDIFA